MVLDYFGSSYKIEELKKLVESGTKGATWTMGLAKAAAELGFKVSFF